MSFSRRSFLVDSAILSTLPALFANPELAGALAAPDAQPTRTPTAGELYWSSLYASGSHRGRGPRLPQEDRDPRIAYFNDKTGIRWVEDIKTTELPVFQEDAIITMELSGFRAGQGDTSNLAKVRFAQLHLSCQRVTASEFLGPIVWASLATVFAGKANKLPSEQSMNWSTLAGNQRAGTNQPQTSSPRLTHMVLNQGAGHMNVAISTTPIDSPLHKVLAVLITGTSIMTPLLGFPGIALPALQSFYDFYGKIEQARTDNFLLNTAQKDVAVTQSGIDNPQISASALKLVSGDYILIPKAHEEEFQKGMDKLIVQNGYAVERDAKGTLDDRIAMAVPDVTYATLSVRVQPASSYPTSSTVTDPLLDSLPRGSASGDPGAGGAPPKKTNSN
jgi:hypothetical protein